jgi:hypothetical protein
MTDHHHPDEQKLKPATAKQQRYLRVLARRTRTTFTPPRTSSQASAEIRRLQQLADASRTERQLDDRHVSRELHTGASTAARIREDETTTTGFGATARWA